MGKQVEIHWKSLKTEEAERAVTGEVEILSDLVEEEDMTLRRLFL